MITLRRVRHGETTHGLITVHLHNMFTRIGGPEHVSLNDVRKMASAVNDGLNELELLGLMGRKHLNSSKEQMTELEESLVAFGTREKKRVYMHTVCFFSFLALLDCVHRVWFGATTKQ